MTGLQWVEPIGAGLRLTFRVAGIEKALRVPGKIAFVDKMGVHILTRGIAVVLIWDEGLEDVLQRFKQMGLKPAHTR